MAVGVFIRSDSQGIKLLQTESGFSVFRFIYFLPTTVPLLLPHENVVTLAVLRLFGPWLPRRPKDVRVAAPVAEVPLVAARLAEMMLDIGARRREMRV
jgi:hypothetical protein